ncbi:hypothetical protein [Neolewinella agarilytica]|uniref:Uncharacterized protein n=1 Tax=Neolewinella agarilytica TaxID=478744 RepID=A0A1H9F3J7_9BACT|nr:hypothetical protein [Neolewinella agarilytica]SEQ31788.1 hypothetical protein SAMN05444359_10848 [Neolewinella agarilytica]
MTRMMIEVTNEETLNLIRSLEALQLLRVVTEPSEPLQIDESWVGSISKKTGEAMLAHVEESKNEWDRNF